MNPGNKYFDPDDPEINEMLNKLIREDFEQQKKKLVEKLESVEQKFEELKNKSKLTDVFEKKIRLFINTVKGKDESLEYKLHHLDKLEQYMDKRMDKKGDSLGRGRSRDLGKSRRQKKNGNKKTRRH